MKIGDYVRTHGYIDKIININDFREPSMKYALEQPSWNDDVIFIGEEDITKSSSNIIDLIEVGDYVNGVRVDEIVYIGHGKSEDLEIAFRYKYAFEKDDVYTLKEENIKAIVTKEQFESMEYKVGD